MPLTDEQILALDKIIPWLPQEGPQDEAYWSEADMILYGGAAGGGKTDLAIGLALTQHTETLFIRRQARQLGAVLDRVASIIDPERKGWSGQEGRWILPPWDGQRRQLVIGSTPNPGDETKYQGRPRDLLVVDECANMTETSVSFLKGWVRSTVPGQRCRTLLCSNPPTSAEGAWLVEWFAPWLDPYHPNPASPGELRWFAMVDGKEIEVDSGDRFMDGSEEVIPQSRTFIPAKLDDNKYLRDTGYRATLQALPEPLRSQMLYGDFRAGGEDDAYAVIPSEWVRQAQQRWTEKPRVQDAITSAAVDPSRGGRDHTVISTREGWHYHELEYHTGHDMKSGGDVAARVIELCGQSHCPVHVDSIGIGAAVVDALDMYIPNRVVPCNAAAKGEGSDWSGALKFANKRAEMWWRMRDLLNPENGQHVALPKDRRLYAELCAPTYRLTPSGIQIEKKEDIVKRLGKSTDAADAVIMCAERGRPMQIKGINPSRFRVSGGINS